MGDTRIAPNGYHYTKTETGWRLTHHIVAEHHLLGRPIDTKTERVIFLDKDRSNLEPYNLQVVPLKAPKSKASRIAVLEAKIAELQAELDSLRNS